VHLTTAAAPFAVLGVVFLLLLRAVIRSF